MRFVHRFMSEYMTNETSSDSLCDSSCIEELKDLGYCSSVCFNKCPTICKIVVVTGLSPPQVIHHDDNFKRILIIVALSIMTTLFLLTLLVICFKFYNRRRSIAISRRWSMEEARNWDFDGPSIPVMIDHPVWNIRTIGLNPSVISSIKVYKYSKKDGVVEGTDCSVCLSEFKEEETLRLLPKCRHAFHLSCIDTWLISHTNCPLCRAPIVVDNEVNDDDGEDREESLVRIPEENGEPDEETERDDNENGFITRYGEADESQQRVRRSVSLDSLRVSEVVAGREKEKVRRGNSISGRSSFFKRSISYNGK